MITRPTSPPSPPFAPSMSFGPQVRNIWAVGRNYVEHAKELGHAVVSGDSSEPMIFLKAGTCLVEPDASFRLPSFSSDVHHEVEVALRFGPGLRFTEITVALDLTARDIQTKLKTQGHPWTLAKSFQASCPIGRLQKIPDGLDLGRLKFALKVNGEVRQKGHTSEMIHSAEALRHYVIERFPVIEGDLLLTGTPAGVGPLRPGDHLEAEITGLVRASWRVAL